MLRGGEAGLLVEDAVAVSKAITRLLDEPELSTTIARRAREEAERYTWHRVGAEWEALYNEMLGGGREEVLAHV
jgi:glycosyltransferase involved in cell wall biosynthesis